VNFRERLKIQYRIIDIPVDDAGPRAGKKWSTRFRANRAASTPPWESAGRVGWPLASVMRPATLALGFWPNAIAAKIIAEMNNPFMPVQPADILMLT
jgi:hypothetical protein